MGVQKQVRTTISLPAASLAAAKREARERNVSLSSVVAEALAQTTKQRQSRARADTFWERYRRTYAGFSEEETMILSGIDLEKQR